MDLFKKIKSWLTPSVKSTWTNTPTVYPADFKPTRNTGSLKLGIIVGHTKTAPGAVVAAPIKSYEYFVNSQLADAMKAYAKAKYPQVKVEIIKRDGIGVSGAYAQASKSGCDCVVELHFNAFNKKAYGTETLCTNREDDKKFSLVIQKKLVAIFERTGLGNRGLKILSLSDRAGKNVAALPSVPNCIVEPFFSDNPAEVELFMRKRVAYTQGLIDAVVDWGYEVSLLK